MYRSFLSIRSPTFHCSPRAAHTRLRAMAAYCLRIFLISYGQIDSSMNSGSSSLKLECLILPATVFQRDTAESAGLVGRRLWVAQSSTGALLAL